MLLLTVKLMQRQIKIFSRQQQKLLDKLQKNSEKTGQKTSHTNDFENESENSALDPPIDLNRANKEKEKNEEKKCLPGHGRNGKNSYLNSDHFQHQFEPNAVNEECPCCHKKTLKKYHSRIILRIEGTPMFQAEQHLTEQMRCAECQPICIPKGFGKSTVTSYSAAALLAVLHYSKAIPFKRLETLQQGWGIPFPDSTQDEIMRDAADCLSSLDKALEEHAIKKATDVLADDGSANVVELHRKIKQELKEAKANGLSEKKVRTGINTTSIRIETPDGVILRFYTSRRHTGEVLRDLFGERDPSLAKIRLTTDAASKNFSADALTLFIHSVCNAHGYLKAKEVSEHFPEFYAIVGEAYKNIFDNDAYTKTQGMDPQQRLKYHQQYSTAWMNKIKNLCNHYLEKGLVEPSSKLWEPIHFFINQWEKLSQYLLIPGIALDTNFVEQQVNTPMRYFLASFSFLTIAGAKTGDLFMSIIETAIKNGLEPVSYLHYCFLNHKDFKLHPEKYFPWNCKTEVKALESAFTRKRAPPDFESQAS